MAGGAYLSPNVMPSQVVVRGTARYFRKEAQAVIRKRLEELAKTLASAHGCQAQFAYEPLVPPTVNWEEKMETAIAAARDVVGEDNVGDIPLSTGGEDFAFMLQKKPGVFMRIGNGLSADGSFHNVHTPHYDFNDAILPLGAAYWASLVQQELGWPGEERR